MNSFPPHLVPEEIPKGAAQTKHAQISLAFAKPAVLAPAVVIQPHRIINPMSHSLQRHRLVLPSGLRDMSKQGNCQHLSSDAHRPRPARLGSTTQVQRAGCPAPLTWPLGPARCSPGTSMPPKPAWKCLHAAFSLLSLSCSASDTPFGRCWLTGLAEGLTVLFNNVCRPSRTPVGWRRRTMTPATRIARLFANSSIAEAG
ncbi:uncharacterized protein IWZ02DRAFT_10962 [Phyllosticta citriasiana]|uniref:uncharacterized protein n=1 Tax=Phyllosticta citriasiana TaxID=595635 RepID=UPI0030FD814E